MFAKIVPPVDVSKVVHLWRGESARQLEGEVSRSQMQKAGRWHGDGSMDISYLNTQVALEFARVAAGFGPHRGLYSLARNTIEPTQVRPRLQITHSMQTIATTLTNAMNRSR